MSNARALTHRLSVIMTTQRGRRTDPIDPSLRPFLIGEVFRFIDAIRSISRSRAPPASRACRLAPGFALRRPENSNGWAAGRLLSALAKKGESDYV